MKFLRFFILALAGLLLLGVIGLFILLKTFNSDRYLPQMTRQASQALGCKVSIGHVGLALSYQGLSLEAGPLRIANDPSLAQGDLLNVRNVRLTIDIGAFFIRRQIHITDLQVQDPQIHLIRSAQGTVNVQALGISHHPAGVPQTVPQTQAEKHSAAIPSWLALSIKTIELHNLGVTFSDKTTGLSLQAQFPSMAISLPPLQGGNSGIAGWKAKAEFSGATLKTPFLLNPATEISGKITADTHDIHLTALSIKAASGTIQAHADIKGFLNAQDFDVQMSVSGVRLEELSGQKDWPFQIKGQLSGQCQITGKGFAPRGLLENLKGSGEMELSQGVLEHFNIAQIALKSAVSAIPGVGDVLGNLLNGALQGQLGGDNTNIEKAQMKFSLHDAAVFIDSALMQTKTFDLTAQGSMNDRLLIDLQTMLLLSPELSATITAKSKAFGYLMDDRKRIAIGAQVIGTLPHLKYKPNAQVKKATQSALIDQGTQQLQKVIEKNPEVGQILNSIFGSSSSSNAASASPSATPSSSDSTQKTINNLLQNILK